VVKGLVLLPQHKLVGLDHLGGFDISEIRVRCDQTKQLAKKHQPFDHASMPLQAFHRRPGHQQVLIFLLGQLRVASACVREAGIGTD